MFPNVPNEIKEFEFLEPVVIVNHFCRVATRKIQEFFQLTPNAGNIVQEDFFGKKVSFRRLSGRITYHACRSAHEGNRFVTRPLEVQQSHDLRKVSDM